MLTKEEALNLRQMFICPEENWQAEAALGLHIRTEHPETLIYGEEQ
jgi:hypothetical protein